jgi:D-aminopeptidase
VIAVLFTGCSLGARTNCAFGAENRQEERARVHDLGVSPGVLPTGDRNAITDVDGVRIGHVTLFEGDNVRTGVTAIVPHSNDVFMNKVPVTVFAGNDMDALHVFAVNPEGGSIEVARTDSGRHTIGVLRGVISAD